MTPMTLTDLDDLLAQNPEYQAAKRDLRPDLELANDVITLRVEAKWTQADLAAQVGTNQANISRLEGALANPTLKFLKKLARALGAELDIRLRRPDDFPEAYRAESILGAHSTRDVTAQPMSHDGWDFSTVTPNLIEASTQNSVSC